MLQQSLFPPPSLTVSEITRYLRELFESDEILREVWIQGEISNLSRPASGHIYFVLKDQNAALKCVIWKQTASRMPLTLQNGMAIEVHGAIGIYERDGQYQLYADAIRLTGEGALYQEFLRLKASLEAEGLFAPERKVPLPEIPTKIGIVTSKTGAALQDILNTLKRRFPLVEVVLAPCAVQGEEAPPQIINAIQGLNQELGMELILVARGGGSLEDLWAFNDERVVRAIADSSVPIITGIGHETDFTLADFAADVRAATPTAAAELAVPDRSELREQISAIGLQLAAAWRQRYNEERSALQDLSRRLALASPAWEVRNDRQRLDELQGRLIRTVLHELKILRGNTLNLSRRLATLSPEAVLQRGYAIVRTTEGKLVYSVQQVHRDDLLDIRVSDGIILSKVEADSDSQVNGGKSND
ncbi:MAG: exodeoxyribonuclease VII large subunit [Anaerolineaceae bacterium]